MSLTATCRMLLPALLFALAPLVDATTVYKYRGADGVMHYTDRNPGRGQKAEVLDLWGGGSAGGGLPEQRRVVFVEKRGTPAQPELFLINRNPAPVEVSFRFSPLDNVRPLQIPAHWIAPANSETRIAALAPLRADQPPRYDYQLRWQLGDPHAQPQARFAYYPPVPAQSTFTITQGFNGSYSHHTDSSRYAVDIDMPIGTGIRAARGGVVVKVIDAYGAGGDSVAYRSRTNSLYILHDDGTFAIYAHLRRGSALVQPGQRVQRGQLIAQSGNSGYSTGPHLHFAVLRNAGLHWQSVPFVFAGAAGTVEPVRGLALTGLAPFGALASREQGY